MPHKNGKLDYEKVKYMNDNNITNAKQQLAVMHEKEDVSSLHRVPPLSHKAHFVGALREPFGGFHFRISVGRNSGQKYMGNAASAVMFENIKLPFTFFLCYY